jgi:hypothetical protein
MAREEGVPRTRSVGVRNTPVALAKSLAPKAKALRKCTRISNLEESSKFLDFLTQRRTTRRTTEEHRSVAFREVPPPHFRIPKKRERKRIRKRGR